MEDTFKTISCFICVDISKIITEYIYKQCSRCKQNKRSSNFRILNNRIITICNSCAKTVKDIKEIKFELSFKLSQHQLTNVLKIRFSRRIYEKKLLYKTVKKFLEVNFSNYDFSICDDFEKYYLVNIIDPNNLIYKTDDFYRNNFNHCNPGIQRGSVPLTACSFMFTLEQMDLPISFNQKKIRIETQMCDLIYYNLSGGRGVVNVTDDFYIYCERLQTDLMKEYVLPKNCTNFQLLKIIDTFYPKTKDEFYWFDSFNDTNSTFLTVNWKNG